jgi:outer membrane autotransporter protein
MRSQRRYFAAILLVGGISTGSGDPVLAQICPPSPATNPTGQTLTVTTNQTCSTGASQQVNSAVLGINSRLLLNSSASPSLILNNIGGLSELNLYAGSSISPLTGTNVSIRIDGSSSSVTNGGSISLGNGSISINSPGSFSNAGDITASTITTSTGADSFSISSGTVNADLNQGAGIDDFSMTGGSLKSLAQGDGRDTFTMSGGRIIGAFEDGDVATFSGGRIGRVDMKLDNNIFTMSGGQIDGNLVTGFGNDTINISGGSIGGNISVSGGTDSVAITGGQVNGEVRMSTGNDTFLWANDGIVLGLIDLGPDNDSATLRNLSSQITNTAGFSGGLGTDSLVLDNTQATAINRFSEWESIQLTNGSRFSLDQNLVLGDAGTGSGSISVDASSSLVGVNGVNSVSFSPYSSGALATLTNAGTIDLTAGDASHRFTINGNYSGNNGTVALQTVLGNDASATDRLIVNGGSISGTSLLAISNAGGAGAASMVDGIQVVQATGGATSTNSAFRLRDRVRAGAYEYYLYKGGVSAGSANSWYLRSSLPTPITPEEPPQLAAPPEGAPNLPNQGLASGSQSNTPIYRDETPIYAMLPALGRQLTLFSLSTFHDRRGDQRQLGIGKQSQVWWRTAGSGWQQQWGGTVEPEFDGSLLAFNLGVDLGTSKPHSGGSRRWGAMFSLANASGGARGFTYALSGNGAGNLQLQTYGLSLYGTHVDRNGWYVEAIAGGNTVNSHLQSFGGINKDPQGWGWSLSLESGYPIQLGKQWSLEPELQLIGVGSSINSFSDGIASMDLQSPWQTVLRSGLRLAYTGSRWQPFVRANVWTSFAGQDGVTYDGGETITTTRGDSTVQLGGGVVWKVSEAFGLEASIDYVTQASNTSLSGVAGNLQMRIKL